MGHETKHVVQYVIPGRCFQLWDHRYRSIWARILIFLSTSYCITTFSKSPMASQRLCLCVQKKCMIRFLVLVGRKSGLCFEALFLWTQLNVFSLVIDGCGDWVFCSLSTFISSLCVGEVKGHLCIVMRPSIRHDGQGTTRSGLHLDTRMRKEIARFCIADQTSIFRIREWTRSIWWNKPKTMTFLHNCVPVKLDCIALKFWKGEISERSLTWTAWMRILNIR